MLSHLDEHFYHQIGTTLDRTEDPDPRWVDQHWFQAMDTQGRFIVGANWPVFINNNVVECGQIIVHGDTQYNLRYQREWRQQGYRSERVNHVVGPCSMEVLEPMRRARFALAPENPWGISYELEMETLFKPVETRTPIYSRRNGLANALPYFEMLGRWSGWLKVDGQTYDVNAENCWGQRDRCWGTLGGERFQAWLPPAATGSGVSPAGAGRLHWHSHVQFEDIAFWWWLDEHIGHPRLNGTLADNRGGHFDGAITWLRDDPREQIRLVDFKDYDIRSQPGTAKFQAAKVTLVDEYGQEYPLEFEIIAPNATRHIRGEGYGDPEFLGGYHGAWHEVADRYDLADYASYRNFAPAVWIGEQAVNARHGDRRGIGHMEMTGTPPLVRWGFGV
ncbi:MAG: hypothetical protein IT429_20795 [Gemmataceae bacterium]|nr:hypothetical protein [Gemmataceae bacterium]